MSKPAALGFRAHSGWAAAVAVAGTPLDPVIVDRRRIEIADPTLGGSKQPFHAAEPIPFEKAAELIQRVRASSARLATIAVAAMLDELSGKGYRVTGAGMLSASGRPLPNLAAILKSHALIHTAEGEFFRDVLALVCEQRSLAVTRIKEREIWDCGAAACRIAAADLQQRIDKLGRALGPPWRQDEKMASMAAWLALGLTL